MKTKEQVDIEQIWEQFHKTRDERFRNLLMDVPGEVYGRAVVQQAA